MNKVVQIIPVKDKEQPIPGREKVIRVAAYARVSTSSDAQEDSFESQVAHFEDYISNHPGWKLTKIYQDEGVTGLNIKKRKGFRKLLADAEKGLFDKVLVKSISRWGRNTIDSLEGIRTLQSYGIAAVFEKEALDTSQPGSEFILTIMASLAQAESLSISANVQLGYQYKMQRGDHTLAYSRFLGYDRGPEGELVINPVQARTVKYIFAQFLSGVSLAHLVKDLEKRGFRTGTGNDKWTKAAVRRILTNEKMYGAALLSKTITVDVLNKKRAINDGSSQQYYIEHDHEPIVGKQTALLAKGELLRREAMTMGGKVVGPAVYKGKNDFTKKIICPMCGAFYNKANARGQYVWKCNNRVHGYCTAEIIKQEYLEDAVLKATQTLHEKQPVIKNVNVPTLDVDNSDNTMMEAAGLYAINTFADRVREFLKGPKPTQYTSDILRLIEKIELEEDAFMVTFYGDQVIKISRTANTNPRIKRRLKRQ